MHCTGIGTYTSTDRYMDYVASGQKDSFIPAQKDNMYWMDFPVCDYVGAYGYDTTTSIPSKVENLIFDYTKEPPKAAIDYAYSTSEAPADSTALPVEVVEETRQTEGGFQTPGNNNVPLALILAIVAGAGILLAKMWKVI